jgi:hypothetical protein
MKLHRSAFPEHTFDQNVTNRRIGALLSDVAFGSFSEVGPHGSEVSFTTANGHRPPGRSGPKSATSGHSSAGHLTKRWHPMTVKRAIAATA